MGSNLFKFHLPVYLIGMFCWLFLSVALSAERQPWEPGVEKPSAEALASPLYIKPVPAVNRSTLKFSVTEQAGINRLQSPVRGSLPFYRGELKDPANIRLLDGDGKEIPVQGHATSWWPEKTVRWLCLDFLTDIKANERREFNLEYGARVRSKIKTALEVTEMNGAIKINTGKLSISFSKGQKFSGPVVMKNGGTTGNIEGVLVLAPVPEPTPWFAGKSVYKDRPACQVPMFKTPPVLDGKLSDGFWKKAARLGFRFNDALKGIPVAKTEAWIASTNDTLFIGVICHEPDMNSLKSKKRNRDENVWADDCIEILLKSGVYGAGIDKGYRHDEIDNPFDPNYHHIAVNPDASIFDTFRNHTYNQFKDFNGTRAAVSKDADAWIMETAIPFDSLRRSKNKKNLFAPWRLNIIRNRGDQSRPQAWSPTGGDSTHVADRLGYLFLESFGSKLPANQTLEAENQKRRKTTLAIPLTIDDLRVVEKGPVQATVYLKGRYGDDMVEKRNWRSGAFGYDYERYPVQKAIYWKSNKFTFHGYVRVYGDTCRMEVIHSFGYNGDEDLDMVKRYGLILPVAAAKGTSFVYGGDLGKRTEAKLSKSLQLVQGRHNWWKLSGDSKARGRRFGGWGALKTPAGFTTVGLRNAWQQWPVMIEAALGKLGMYMYGAPEGEFLDLRYNGPYFGASRSMYVGPRLSGVYSGGGNGLARGILKISELVFDFASDPEDVGGGAHLPLIPFASSKRIADTKAFGHIGTYGKRKASGVDTDSLKIWANAMLDFPIIQHEANGMYGWVDWPDQGDCSPPKNGKFEMIMQGGKGWTNSERALLAYYFHYAAGGHEKYFHLGHAMSLHTIGIDLEHPGGDMMPGTPHRHNQVHWRGGGGPRQCGILGWFADYWLTGNREIRRILFDIYMPKHSDNLNRDPVLVLISNKSGAQNYPVLWAYLTDNNPDWIMTHKGIDEVVMKISRMGHGTVGSWSGGFMFWKEGHVKKINSKKGKFATYFYTYGADDRLAEHASLFGYDVSLKAIKAWGDAHDFGSKDRDRNPILGSSYASSEGGCVGYYLLTKDSHVLSGLRMRVEKLTHPVKGKPIEWDTYKVKGTAEDWHRHFGRGYGKNGFKIVAAIIHENLRSLAAFEFAAQADESQDPK